MDEDGTERVVRLTVDGVVVGQPGSVNVGCGEPGQL